jgi:small-conductance mechanosensitive channel
MTSESFFSRVIFNDVTAGDLLVAGGVLLATFAAVKLVSLYLRATLKERISQDNLEILVKVIYYGVIGIAFVYVLHVVGVNLSGLMVAGGFAGIVVGLASQSIVGNFISGLFLIIERPIKIGDQINVNDLIGYVEDIRIISTTIRTYDGLFVRIPNEKVFTSNIINYVNHVVRRFEYTVGIRYSDCADTAIDIISTVIEEQPFALKRPSPQVFVDTMGDNAVNIIVRIWSPVSEWYGVKMKLLWKIKTALEQQGIEIAFPQRVIWFGDKEHKSGGPGEAAS